jgi:hypothetical protein
MRKFLRQMKNLAGFSEGHLKKLAANLSVGNAANTNRVFIASEASASMCGALPLSCLIWVILSAPPIRAAFPSLEANSFGKVVGK